MADLISSHENHFPAYWTSIDVRHHPIRLKMHKLDRESFELMTVGDIVLDALLELLRCEIASTNPLIFIVGESCGQNIAQLGIPLCVQVVFILSHAANLLF